MSTQLDSFGGWKGVSADSTGFFYLKEIDGRWWFIDPEGNGFISVGVNHIYQDPDAAVFNEIYNGDLEAWAEADFAYLKECGFNSLYWTGGKRNVEACRKHNYPYAVTFSLIDHPVSRREGPRPDVFSEAFEESCKNLIEKVAAAYREDPIVLGYMYAGAPFTEMHDWLNDIFALPADAAGKVALVQILRELHSDDLDSFNELYGSKFDSFDDLLERGSLRFNADFDPLGRMREGLRVVSDEQLRDFDALCGAVVARLAFLAEKYLREGDPNHLVLGPSVKEYNMSEAMWKALAPHVDVLGPQHNELVNLHELCAETGVPILISDENVGMPPHPDQHHGRLVKGQKERGEIYEHMLELNLGYPFVVGAHMCGGAHDNIRKLNPNYSKNGLKDAKTGQPHKEAVSRMKRANAKIYDYAANPLTKRKLAKLKAEQEERWYRALVDGLWPTYLAFIM